MSLPTFALQSAVTATAPFTFGHAFKQGDVPMGQGVVASGAASFQCFPKNAWPDGSLKFAVLSGTAALTANTPLSLTLAAGAATSGTALTLADLKATGITAAIGAGAFGSASWAGNDWDTPDRTWVSGPVMSSWLFRKAIGGDAHLMGWLEVRLYATGAVEVLPWVENGYLFVTGGSNKSETYTFTLGGVQRVSVAFNLPGRCRAPLINGAALSYWLGTDPGVSPIHDRAYLQATELVPTYSASVAANAVVATKQPVTFAPLQMGSFTYGSDAMGSTGYQEPIGLLPEHDVVFLTVAAAGVPAQYGQVVRNGYSAGRYAVHYRDESTQRPIRFSAYPNLSSNASSTNQYPAGYSGGGAPAWDVPHHPSVGFVAYLLSGHCYHMETVQFAATNNFLYQVNNVRQGSDGVFMSWSGASTTRGAAWSIRTLAQATVATPDADPLKAEFVASLTANVNYNHATYVAQPNNPFGIVAPYGDAYGGNSDGRVQEAMWQQDFYTSAYGYALAMKAVGGAALTKLAAFFAWKARSVIGRLGGLAATDWLYRDAAPYTMVVANVDFPDWLGGTGPFPSDWGAMYLNTIGVQNPGVAGDLRGGNFPSSVSYWGNLLPAISYAVRHKVAGAAEAYARLTGAGNWSQLATDGAAHPVWMQQPAAVVDPEFAGVGRTLLIDTEGLYPGYLTIDTDFGHGTLGSVILSTLSAQASGGTHDAPLYNDVDTGDENKEFRAEVTTLPFPGFKMNGDSSFVIPAGTANGSYTLAYRLWVDGVDRGVVTDTIVIGQASNTVTADLVGTFRVRSVVQQSLAGTFSVRGLATADQVGSFSVRSAVTRDLVGTFSVLTIAQLSPVIVDCVGEFSVRATVETELQAVFSINTLMRPTGGYRAQFRPTSLFRTRPRTNLPVKDPMESVLVEFDFSAECSSLAGVLFEVVVLRGEDDLPEAILDGEPKVQGAKAFQRITGGVNRTVYGIKCVAAANDEDTLVTAALLAVRDKVAQ